MRIEKNEIGLVFLMFLQTFLTGFFIGSFDISMHAIFLNFFNPSVIQNVYVLAGISGILIMIFYTWFSTRLKFRFLTVLNYLFILVVTSAILYFSYFDITKNYIFLGFSLMFPLNILVYLNFQRSQSEIFRPVQAKRLGILMQAAFFAGVIGAGYGSLLFLYLSEEYIMILASSVASIFIAFILQLIINPIHKKSPAFYHSPKRINPIRSRLIELFYSRYTFLLMLFVILSSVTGYLLHYSFIYSTWLSYPYFSGFIKFLGLFTGTLFLFTFFVDKFLIRKILYSYDSPYSLFLIPVTLIISLLVSVGIYFTIGNDRILSRFSIFFLVIAMVKVVYELFRYDVEIPSFRVLFKTLDIRFHGTINTRIEGTIRCAGLAFTGLILIGIMRLKFIQIIHLNIITLIISLLWLLVAVLLIKNYKKALQLSIKRLRASKGKSELFLKAADEKLHSLINHKSSSRKIINSLKISEQIEPITFEKHIINVVSNSPYELKKFAIKTIEEKDMLFAYQSLNTINDKNIIALTKKLEQKISLGKTESQIEKLAISLNINDRVLAADLIGYLNKKEFSPLLINLSRDFEPEVKMASVRAMARVAFPETCSALTGFLNSPYYSFAFEALVKIGDYAIDHLETLFDSPESDEALLSRIVKVYGKIGSPSAIDCLLSKIENNSRFISRQSIRALREARFQATPDNINRILNIIVRTINTMSWNLNALSVIKDTDFLLLKKALEGEITDNYRILYNLMALAYNSNSISNIQNFIEEGNDTDISFAIELLDQIVLDEVKQVLFPVLENLTIKARVKQLQYYYQNENLTENDIIPGIITRDFNQISVYTKACAIYSWPKETGISDILVANLFHPNKLMRETSALIIYSINPLFLESVYPRLPLNHVSEIKTSIENIKSGNDFLVLERVEFLKKCRKFSDLPEEILYEIANNLNVIKLPAGYEAAYQKDIPFFITFDGALNVYEESSNKNIVTKKYDLFYFNTYFDELVNVQVKTKSETMLFTLKKNILDMLMFDYSEFRIILLEMIENASE